MLFKIIPNLQCLKFIAGMQFVYNLKEKSLKYVFGLFKAYITHNPQTLLKHDIQSSFDFVILQKT